MSNKTRLVLVFAVVVLVTCISGCDQLLGILTDNQVAETNERGASTNRFLGKDTNWHSSAAHRAIHLGVRLLSDATRRRTRAQRA